MKLIVGLGNPGPKYRFTRHNIGFMFVDALLETHGNRSSTSVKEEFKSETARLSWAGESLLLCKPQTFMNLSGEAVQAISHFYQVKTEEILVVHDEVDLPFGQMRFQTRRGHGGHNGIRNIHQALGTDGYGRLRLGVGRPDRSAPGPEVHEYVLANFSKDEQGALPDFLARALDGTRVWITEGMGRASTLYNIKKSGD